MLLVASYRQDFWCLEVTAFGGDLLIPGVSVAKGFAVAGLASLRIPFPGVRCEDCHASRQMSSKDIVSSSVFPVISLQLWLLLSVNLWRTQRRLENDKVELCTKYAVKRVVMTIRQRCATSRTISRLISWSRQSPK